MVPRILRVLGLALVLAGLSSLGVSAEDIKLRVLSTTDIHTHLYDYDYYRDAPDDFGLARTATLIKKARAESAEHSPDRQRRPDPGQSAR